MSFRIGYLVHDLNDAAVAKRCAIMLRGGADVQLAGFRRGSAPSSISGIKPLDLGETADGALGQRALAVIRNVALPKRARQAAEGCDIIVARNLETLAIAQRISDGRPVVYECLDIHRTLLDTGPAGTALRRIEARLLATTRAIITSSPAFVREYFDKRPTGDAEIRLEENRILLPEAQREGQFATLSPPKAGPPWVIGWFGMLRCRRTLQELANLAAHLHGNLEILIAGKPSPTELPGLEATVSALPYLRYLGAYSPGDLPELYGQCHFAWAIDWFEEGQNSEWLLPNRLYEATAYGSIPIVLKRHEVGRWLAEKDAGLQINDTTGLGKFFGGLDAVGYTRLRGGVLGLPRDAVMMGDRECQEFVSWLKRLA